MCGSYSGPVIPVTKASSSLSESVRELTSESGSMVEVMMTFACLDLPLDFFWETVVHYPWSSRRSRWTHITPPSGVKVETNSFSHCWCGYELMILISTARMEKKAVGVG